MPVFIGSFLTEKQCYNIRFTPCYKVLNASMTKKSRHTQIILLLSKGKATDNYRVKQNTCHA